MTTKSPTSTCGAYWGLCLPRSSCAVWLASRPSTTSVASMTCQARVMSPGLGEYVRTRLTVLRRIGRVAGEIAPPSTGDLGVARRRRGPRTRAHQPASRTNRERYQREPRTRLLALLQGPAPSPGWLRPAALTRGCGG